jgi:hypothetical protein
LIASIVLLALLVAVGAPPIARLLLVIPVAVSASGYLQAYLKFCAGFGTRGIYNFGDVGNQPTRSPTRPRGRLTRRRRCGSASRASRSGSGVALVAMLLPI